MAVTTDFLAMIKSENANQREEINRLQQENDKLRAELLKAPNANMVAFIASFNNIMHEQYTADILGDLVRVWDLLKEQHGLATKDGE